MVHRDLSKHIQAVVHERAPDIKDWEFAREVIHIEDDPSHPDHLKAQQMLVADERKQIAESEAAAVAEAEKAAKDKTRTEKQPERHGTRAE